MPLLYHGIPGVFAFLYTVIESAHTENSLYAGVMVKGTIGNAVCKQAEGV